MTISLSCSNLPSSSWYSGTGSTNIVLSGAIEIIANSKKSLTKTPQPQASSSYLTGVNFSDKGKNKVIDLKKIEDTIKLRGWLIDTTSSSAWNQAWQLRGMAVKGGPIDLLTIENLSFNTSSQQAWLEEVNFIASPARALGLKINETSSASIGKPRIQVDLSIYLGDTR